MAKGRRVAILGAGTIGEWLRRGLLSGGWREPSELVFTVRDEQRATNLSERYGVEATTSNAEAVAGAALVVIAVKPQDFDALLGEIGGLLTPEQTVLSVAAAIPTSAIEGRIAKGVPVVRAMPNRKGQVHEGIAGVCAGAHAGDVNLTLAEEALSHLGAVVRVPERYMDAVTAVSGSGPAYFALLAEAMIEAGILLGLSREISTQLVVQTMLGTAKLLRDEHVHPVELREQVRAALPAQPRGVPRIQGELGPEAAAAGYDAELESVQLDLVLLGIGPDGHAASLFPNQPTLDERSRRAIPAEAKLEPFVDRVTMTLPALCSAPEVLFLVSGDSKAEAVEHAFGRSPSQDTPSSLIRSADGRTRVVADAAAAARLPD